MRYDIDYTWAIDHLFEFVVLMLLFAFIVDFYGRYYKIQKSTDEFDSSLYLRYATLKRMRNKLNGKL